MANEDNFTRLSQAISLLGDSLRPYVERELKRGGGNWWTQYVLPNVPYTSRQRFPAMPERGSGNQLAMADLSDLLSLLTRNWNEVFRGKLPPPARSWANELLDTRNQWAHKTGGDVPSAMVNRAIDTAALLLDGIDAAAAKNMRLLFYPGPSISAARPLLGRISTPGAISSTTSRPIGKETYWAIAPCNQVAGERVLGRVLQFDMEHGCIAIGWGQIRGDIGSMDESTLKAEIRRQYPEDGGGAWRSLLAFYHHVQIGDYVFSRTGRSTALAFGRVTSPAYRDDDKGYERMGGLHAWNWPHFRDVEWLSTRNEFFDHYVFSIPTVTRLGIHLEEVLARYSDAGR